MLLVVTAELVVRGLLLVVTAEELVVALTGHAGQEYAGAEPSPQPSLPHPPPGAALTAAKAAKRPAITADFMSIRLR